jgi:hypothetical protein
VLAAFLSRRSTLMACTTKALAGFCADFGAANTRCVSVLS